MKKIKFLGVLIGIAICAYFVYFMAQQLPYILEHLRPEPGPLLLLVGLSLVVYLIRAIMNRIIFKPLGVDATTLHWVGIVAVGTLANTLPFIAGSIAKGFYLKKSHDLPYRIFTGGQIALFALVLCTNGILGLLLLFAFYREQASPIVWALFGLMACSGLILILPKTIQRYVGKERFPWPELPRKQELGIWFRVGLCQVGILLLIAGKLYLCFAMGLEGVTYTACLLFSASVAITRLVSITPGSIGIREFLIASIAHLLGFQFNDALIASTVDRLLDLVIVAILTGFLGLYHKKTQKPTEVAD